MLCRNLMKCSEVEAHLDFVQSREVIRRLRILTQISEKSTICSRLQDLFGNSIIVIPAKAGTRREGFTPLLWIPACAGMTVSEQLYGIKHPLLHHTHGIAVFFTRSFTSVNCFGR